MKQKEKQRKGLAMVPMADRLRICSMGGRAAHAGGMKADGSRRRKKAHEWNGKEAREAGRKGGLASR